MERSLVKRKQNPTPGVKDIRQQTLDPQSPGSRGLEALIKDKNTKMPKDLKINKDKDVK
jgi:hypothetical protein